MKKQTVFEKFAPAILKIYHRDNEARQILIEYSAPFGPDVSTWDSNCAQYLKDAD